MITKVKAITVYVNCNSFIINCICVFESGDVTNVDITDIVFDCVGCCDVWLSGCRVRISAICEFAYRFKNFKINQFGQAQTVR